MKPTGLPPLNLPPLEDAQHRSLTLWLSAATERVRREAATTSMSGEAQRGRLEGAQRLAVLLLNSVTTKPKEET